ncbi:hypothetical protein V6R21_14145 [Limibacter armeniacum]|uniref:hypothetical protein n=1 Tax=Limibacter armeniacum TaxID=466084 RepID=UPI002FE63AB4
MRKFSISIALFLSVLMLSSCIDDTEPISAPYDYYSHYNFGMTESGDIEGTTQGWEMAYSEVAEENVTDYDFKLDSIKRMGYWGLDISNNNQEEAFQYIKTSISGLQPNTNYSITMKLKMISFLEDNILSDTQMDSSSVSLKFGAFTSEISTELDENNVIRLKDLDLGSVSESGDDLQKIGNIPVPKLANNPLQLFGNNFDEPISAKTDESGNLWVALGFHTKAVAHHGVFFDEVTLYFKGI